MADYNLKSLSTRSFEQLIQSLAIKVIGPGVNIFGDGPDGGREATFEGTVPYPSLTEPWNGYGVIQAKFLQRPRDTRRDGEWALQQLRSELKKFADPKKTRRKPDYYIFATNVVLTPAQGKGSKDKAAALFKEFEKRVPLKGFDIWDYDKICAFLDAHEDVRKVNSFITPGDVLAEVIELLTARTNGFGQATAGGDKPAKITRPEDSYERVRRSHSKGPASTPGLSKCSTSLGRVKGAGAFIEGRRRMVVISLCALLTLGAVLISQWRYSPRTSDRGIRNIDYLPFKEGDPGVPGDGLLISAVGRETLREGKKIPSYEFSLKQPFPLSGIRGGIDASIFLPPGMKNIGEFDNLQVNFSNLKTSGPCKLETGGTATWRMEQISLNNANGLAFSIPQSFLEGIIRDATGPNSECGFKTDDLNIVSLSLSSSRLGRYVATLDAVKFSPGKDQRQQISSDLTSQQPYLATVIDR